MKNNNELIKPIRYIISDGGDSSGVPSWYVFALVEYEKGKEPLKFLSLYIHLINTGIYHFHDYNKYHTLMSWEFEAKFHQPYSGRQEERTGGISIDDEISAESLQKACEIFFGSRNIEYMIDNSVSGTS